jgi:nucleotide-binding universal stress UspA family protein
VSPRTFRVLVAVDFSPQSLAALRAARALVKRAPGELTIVHVRPSSDVRAAVLEERGDLLRLPAGGLSRSMASHYERRLADLPRPAARESVRLLNGEPAREICREAARGYDLIAMGSRGRGSAAAFLLGSTVQEVLVQSRIPLLVVPAR